MNANEIMSNQAHARRLRQLLVALLVTLIFEGLARKAAPGFIRVPIFFIKDVLVLVMGAYVMRMPMPVHIRPIWSAYIVLSVLMVPSIFVTACHDPILAIFGTKQYLLFPIVGFATFLAYENSSLEVIQKFYSQVAFFVIPTALLAFVQSHLPTDHWLNMSVNGESLSGFSAAGQLRVSSTFSFVAQYCVFLNAEAFIVMIALQGLGQKKLLWKLIGLLLLPLIVFSSFVTGSRSAVVGNLTIILMAGVLAFLKLRMRNIYQIGLLMGALYIMVLALNYLAPTATAAYSARENGHLIGVSAEIQSRVLSAFVDNFRDKSMQTFLGNGLGIMSNGSDVFSDYAATWRMRLWTESDFPTTLFEGGYYLVIVWYGFRLYVIFKTTIYFLKLISADYAVPIAFCQAFVIIVGTLGTLAMQPPTAIWWWFGVGTSLLFTWKCIAPAGTDLHNDNPPPPAPRRKVRGRSLYAEVIHTRK